MAVPKGPLATNDKGEVIRPWGRIILTKDKFILHRWARVLRNDETKDPLHRDLAKQGVKFIDIGVDTQDGGKVLYVYPVPVHELNEDDRERLISWADTCGYSKVYLHKDDDPIELDGKVKYPASASVKCPVCSFETTYNSPSLKTWVEFYGRLPEFCHACAGESIPQWEAKSKWKKRLFGRLTHLFLGTPTDCSSVTPKRSSAISSPS